MVKHDVGVMRMKTEKVFENEKIPEGPNMPTIHEMSFVIQFLRTRMCLLSSTDLELRVVCCMFV